MIARVWRGVTPLSKSNQYQDYLMETGVRGCRAVEGNLGVYVLQRASGDHAEFIFISLWESLDAIRKFAGPNIEKAVYYPRDREFLLELEPNVSHYEVVHAP